MSDEVRVTVLCETICPVLMWHTAFVATNLNIGEYIGYVPKSEFDLAKLVETGLPIERIALLKEQGPTFTEISQIVIFAPNP